jgi:hypothetical protein
MMQPWFNEANMALAKRWRRIEPNGVERSTYRAGMENET